jgi:hypothetical protein
LRILFFLFLFLLPSISYAAGAYLVDDGGIIESKKLQIENWYSHSAAGENIYVSNPAYQIFSNAEFAIQETYSSKGVNNTLWPQLKYLIHKEDGIWSSVTAGVNYSTTDSGIYGNYIYSSTTKRLNKIVDLNIYVGWQNWRHAIGNNKSTDFLNYGLGSEIHLTNDFALIGEFFQTNGQLRNGPKAPAIQAATRYIATHYLVLDLIYGRNINGNRNNWVTFGAAVIF